MPWEVEVSLPRERPVEEIMNLVRHFLPGTRFEPEPTWKERVAGIEAEGREAPEFMVALARKESGPGYRGLYETADYKIEIVLGSEPRLGTFLLDVRGFVDEALKALKPMLAREELTLRNLHTGREILE
jgi:hypothetical protein